MVFEPNDEGIRTPPWRAQWMPSGENATHNPAPPSAPGPPFQS